MIIKANVNKTCIYVQTNNEMYMTWHEVNTFFFFSWFFEKETGKQLSIMQKKTISVKGNKTSVEKKEEKKINNKFNWNAEEWNGVTFA